MGVDFAGEGLLDGLDGDARTARLELLVRLEAEGASLDELRGGVRDGLLVFLLAEQLVDGPPRHRLRDVTEAAGVPLDTLVALVARRRARGPRFRAGRIPMVAGRTAVGARGRRVRGEGDA